MLLAAEVPSPRATAVLMPITSPRMLASGPPELPEEIAASVWIKLFSAPDSVKIVRLRADTIPVVTLGPPSRASA